MSELAGIARQREGEAWDWAKVLPSLGWQLQPKELVVGRGTQLRCWESGVSKKQPVGNFWSTSPAEPLVPGREHKERIHAYYPTSRMKKLGPWKARLFSDLLSVFPPIYSPLTWFLASGITLSLI